jgi:adenylosuccinate synthase
MDQSDNAPHLTPSNTGVKNVTEILNEITDCNWSDVHMELVFILRSYMTKHGNGDFRTLQETLQENYSLYDRTNIKNSFQGSIRYGLIDTERTQNLILNQRYIFEKEFKYFEEANPDALLAITHLDQTNNKLLTTRGEIPADELDLLFKFDNKAYLSYGETSNAVYECEY